MVDVLPCVVRGLNRCTPHFADTLGLRRSLIHLGDRGQRYLRSFAETRKPSRDRLPPLRRSTPRMLLPRGHQEIKRQESLAAGLPGSRTSGAPMLRRLAASDWQDIPELMEGKKRGRGITTCQNPDGDKVGSGWPCALNTSPQTRCQGCPEVHRLGRLRSQWQIVSVCLLSASRWTFVLTKMSLG